jgi:hypothetical protein
VRRQRHRTFAASLKPGSTGANQLSCSVVASHTAECAGRFGIRVYDGTIDIADRRRRVACRACCVVHLEEKRDETDCSGLPNTKSTKQVYFPSGKPLRKRGGSFKNIRDEGENSERNERVTPAGSSGFWLPTTKPIELRTMHQVGERKKILLVEPRWTRANRTSQTAPISLDT